MDGSRDPYAELAQARDNLKRSLMVQLDRYLGPVVGWLSRRLERNTDARD